MLFSVVILVALAAFWLGLDSLTKPLDARTRKLAFAGAILVFFFVMLFHRRGEVEAAADTHDLRETNIGKVNVGGSTARFVLTSFRGPLIAALWWDSEERKSQHQYQQLDLLYDSLTSLQPHFRSPWIYQGWNFAYNISVEFDRVEDKYAYIAQGIQRIAEGERINRSRMYDPALGARRTIGDPDMRWHIGFMIQDKLSVSDEVNTHRCFFHLSCIPPSQWDPLTLRRNPEAMANLKRAYPQLVRQIRLLKNVPEGAEKQLNSQMLEFFAAHRRVPSLYPPETSGAPELGDVFQPFPIWPEQYRPANPEREESHDPYDIAKAWYLFSIEPLPPPFYDELRERPEMRFYRVPKKMVTIIFRKQPAMAKATQARQLDRDGWFDQSQKAWDESLTMWIEFGNQYKLEMSEDDYQELLKRAMRFANNFTDEARNNEPPPRHRLDEETRKDFEAFMAMRDLEQRRRHANWSHWKSMVKTMATPKATEARRHLYQANANRTDVQTARAEYEEGFRKWKPILVKNRPIDPRQNEVVFLLGLSLQAVPQSFLIQPVEIFDRTEFGNNAQGQEDLGQFHDFYLAVRARAIAPALMHGVMTALQLQNLMGNQAMAPLGWGPLGATPAPHFPITIDGLEDLIMGNSQGPLDLYLHPEVVVRSFRFGRTQTQHSLIPTTAAEGGGAPTPPTLIRPGGGGEMRK